MRRALALALVLAACGDDAGDAAPSPPAPITVAADELATVRTGTVETGPQLSGTLEAARAATVNARLGGTVRAIGPEIGQHGARGALLARIDPGALGAAEASNRAQLASAEAALAVAGREVPRSRALVEAGAIARRDLDQAESQLAAQRAAVDQARAQLAATRVQLGDATVRAPITGTVARRAVNVGDVVAPGAELYRVIDPRSMRLSASVPGDQLGALARGATVHFRVRGHEGRTFTGTITRIAPVADPTTRQIPILVELPNPSRHLLAGLFAQGRIVTRRDAGLVVPAAAIDTSGGAPSVLRLAGDTIERVPVELGLRDPLHDVVLVARGLAAGDRVLANAATAPPPGVPVRVAPARAAPPTS